MTWTLRKKIFLGYGITLGLMIVILIWAFLHLQELGQASDAILRENYRSILAAENMVYALERQDSAILLILLGFEEEGWKQFRENEGQFFQWLGRAKDNITVEGEDKIVHFPRGRIFRLSEPGVRNQAHRGFRPPQDCRAVSRNNTPVIP